MKKSPTTFYALITTLLVGCSESNTSTLEILFEGDSDIELWHTENYKNSLNIGVGGDTCVD